MYFLIAHVLITGNSTTPTPPEPTPASASSASPTTPTPTTPTPLYQSQPCSEYLESLEPVKNSLPDNFFFPKCDTNGQYKPIQCLEKNGGVTCLCYSITGGPYIHSEWTVDCSTLAL